jgi:hypothetical protein
MGGDVSNDQSDLVAALIISLHFLLVVLDVVVGGVILLIYRQKGVKFVNK